MKHIVISMAAIIALARTGIRNEVTLAVAGRTNSTPWIASDGRFVAVAWSAAAAGKGDVMIAVSRDGGLTFATPVRVNAIEGEARISGEIAPRVALLRASPAPIPSSP